MENVNIIFLTNKETDLEYFNGLKTSERDITNEVVKYCRLIENLAFVRIENSYRFFDQLVDSSSKKLTDSGKRLIEQVQEKAFPNSDLTTIIAVHWGEKSITEIKDYLIEVNKSNSESSYKFSYWGSQSDSYRKKNLRKVIAEIIELANIYESKITAEIEEAINIFDKSNQLAINEQKKVITQIIQAIRNSREADLDMDEEVKKILALENIRNTNKEALKKLEKILMR